jgi:hypothetical protein
MKYLTGVPKVIPAGTRLVHNHVRPSAETGYRGFRAWLGVASLRGSAQRTTADRRAPYRVCVVTPPQAKASPATAPQRAPAAPRLFVDPRGLVIR